jgi:hypothetical protein
VIFKESDVITFTCPTDVVLRDGIPTVVGGEQAELKPGESVTIRSEVMGEGFFVLNKKKPIGDK